MISADPISPICLATPQLHSQRPPPNLPLQRVTNLQPLTFVAQTRNKKMALLKQICSPSRSFLAIAISHWQTHLIARNPSKSPQESPTNRLECLRTANSLSPTLLLWGDGQTIVGSGDSVPAETHPRRVQQVSLAFHISFATLFTPRNVLQISRRRSLRRSGSSHLLLAAGLTRVSWELGKQSSSESYPTIPCRL